MGPFLVVVGLELAYQMIHVLLSKDHEIVETFLLQRLDESLNERIGIGRPKSGLLDLHAGGFKDRVE